VAGTVALIDLGANTTSVVIARDGVPQFVRIIPTGGNDLTRELTTGLETDASSADAAKRSLGLASQVSTLVEKQAMEIIYRVASEQLTSLRNTINYWINTRPHDPVHRIVLTGGGAQLRGLADALAEMTRLEVVAGDPFASVALARGLDANDLRQNGASFAVAFGLALGSAA
jgi:type IV pilus assembly protein PilM